MKNKKIRKHKKITKFFMVLFIIVLFFIILYAAINLYVILSTKKYIITPEEAESIETDCILVLGAGVKNDGRPSDMLYDRLVTGIGVYKAGATSRMLMSGDHGREEYDEVNTMKNFAVEREIPSENIFMDHAGFSTYDSMYRARDIFGVKKAVVITQEYHLYRALYIARNMGLEAYGVSANIREYGGQAYFSFRESIARVKDFFTVIFKPHPTYLGKVIPISGNGDITNDK